MLKRDLVAALEQVEDTTDIVFQVSPNLLIPIAVVEPAEAVWNHDYGMYRRINDSSQLIGETKDAVQTVVVLRA